MLTPPDDLPDARVTAALVDGWGLTVAAVSYLPVGFGSHHWRADGPAGRWFVTVDDLDARLRTAQESRDRAFDRLAAALGTARRLADSGLAFVLAPTRDASGAAVRRLSDRYGIAVYPFVDGGTRSWGDAMPAEERRIVLGQIVTLHQAKMDAAGIEDFTILHRDALDAALDDLEQPWNTGPLGDDARTALAAGATAVRRALLAHDRLAERALTRRERFVLTHGEPHAGNVLRTAGGQFLIDWDTCLVAPPERDLRILAESDAAAIAAYTAATGRSIQPVLLDLYRLAWDLSEVAIYVDLFDRPHADTPDARKSYTGLVASLDALKG